MYASFLYFLKRIVFVKRHVWFFRIYIRDAVSPGDYKKLGNIIHKAVPVWETIRIDIPLQELAYMGSLPPEKWAGMSDERIGRLVRAVENAVRKAVTLKEKMNGDNTHSGG